jgi:hypothetical protein
MVTYKEKLKCAAINPVKQGACIILRKLTENFKKAITSISGKKPNLFHERYAEKFPDKDHCQWKGADCLHSSSLMTI